MDHGATGQSAPQGHLWREDRHWYCDRAGGADDRGADRSCDLSRCVSTLTERRTLTIDDPLYSEPPLAGGNPGNVTLAFWRSSPRVNTDRKSTRLNSSH